MVEVEYLRTRLRYDPDTGKLFWLRCDTMPKRWNNRWAGKEAFTAINSKGYRHGSVNYQTITAHRVIWALVYGEWPGVEIDHENHDTTDNRLDNLRLSGIVGNRQNASKSKRNTSGITGISWNKHQQKWVAYIGLNGTTQHIGSFDDIEDAIAARETVQRQLGYHPNHGG